MREFGKRPLALAGLVFYGTASLLAAFSTVCRIIGIVLGFALLVVLLLWRKKRTIARRNGIAAAAALLAASILALVAVDVRIAGAERHAGETAAVVGTVEEVSYTNEYSGQYVVSAVSIGGAHTGAKIRLSTADPSLHPGDSVIVTGTLTLLPENDNGFPARRYYRSRGIFLAMEADEDLPVVIGSEKTFSSLVADLRGRLAGVYASLLPNDEAGLVSALLIGDRDGLPDSAVRDFRALGISHLLAISGLHLSVLMGTLEGILRFFRLRRRARRLLLVPAVVGFMILSGFSASVVRAGCMILICILMSLLTHREDVPSSLAYAAALIILFSPDALFDVGLQLSVSAMLGCFLAGSWAKLLRGKHGKVYRRLILPIVTTCCVLGTVLPLSAVYFGETSLAGPLATVLFSPLVSLLLLCSPVLPLVSAAPTVSAVLAYPVRLLAKAILALASCFAKYAVVLSLHYALAPLLIAAVFLTVVLLPDVRRKARIVLLAVLAAAVLAFAGNVLVVREAEKTRTTVTVVSSGKNDTHLVVAEGEALLIDFSDGSMSALKPALAILDGGTHTSIDALVLTHYHQRHIATVTSLIGKRFVRTIYLPEAVTETELGIADAIIRAADNAGTPVICYPAGREAILFGGTAIFPTERVMLSRSTHPTLAMTIRTFGKTYVYVGASAGEGALAAPLTEVVPAADAVVFGMHGPVGKKPILLAVHADAAVGVSGDPALLSESGALTGAEIFSGGSFSFVFEKEKS